MTPEVRLAQAVILQALLDVGRAAKSVDGRVKKDPDLRSQDFYEARLFLTRTDGGWARSRRDYCIIGEIDEDTLLRTCKDLPEPLPPLPSKLHKRKTKTKPPKPKTCKKRKPLPPPKRKKPLKAYPPVSLERAQALWDMLAERNIDMLEVSPSKVSLPKLLEIGYRGPRGSLASATLITDARRALREAS